MAIFFDTFSCAGEKPPNEDSVIAEILSDSISIFAIADGMGGTVGGGNASRTAVLTAIALLKTNVQVSFAELFENIRKELVAQSERNRDLAKMGTTLTLCKIENRHVHVGHVGDTRLYHLRGKGLRTVTKDQTELQKLIDEGVVTQRRAKTYPRRHVLLSALGPQSEYELQEARFEIEANDRLILLTDGVYNILTKADIANISHQSVDVSALCDGLRVSVETSEHKDDYSAICIEYSV